MGNRYVYEQLLLILILIRILIILFSVSQTEMESDQGNEWMRIVTDIVSI